MRGGGPEDSIASRARSAGRARAQYLRVVPRGTPSWQHDHVKNPVPVKGRSLFRRRLSGAAGRLHFTAFASGLLVLALGLIGWLFAGGPGSIEDLVIVLDLTIGGTILSSGALIGRARAAESRRDSQLRVLQLAAKRMSASLTPEAVGRAVIEEMRSIID